MSFLAIMKATPDGRIAKYRGFLDEAAADAHVAAFTDKYPDAFTAPQPSAPFSHWLVAMAAKTLVIDPPPPLPTPEPAATGAQMIYEAEGRGKLQTLLTALSEPEKAKLYARRRIVAGDDIAEALRTRLGVTTDAMAAFVAAAASRTET